MASSVDLVPSLGHGLVTSQVGPSAGFDSIDDRRAWTGFQRGEGVATYGSFRVSQRAAGANMSVDVNMDDGAFVRGDSVALQGLYYVAPHASTVNVDVSAASGSNPRLDMVVLEVKDNAHDVSGLNVARVRVVAGTATSGATLDNRTGAAALPTSSLLLADVLVATSDTSIIDAEIRDRRQFSAPGAIPPLLTDVDMVAPIGAEMLGEADTTNDLNHITHDTKQAAAAIFIPRRIVGATRIRWAYLQGGTALTGNYILALYDSSGRLIVGTPSTALTGGINSVQIRSETISATTFEPGWHYLLMGLDSSATGSMGYIGYAVESYATNGGGAPFKNVGVGLASGGVTAPTTLLGFTDLNANTSLQCPKVPQIALSVG